MKSLEYVWRFDIPLIFVPFLQRKKTFSDFLLTSLSTEPFCSLKKKDLAPRGENSSFSEFTSTLQKRSRNSALEECRAVDKREYLKIIFLISY